MYETVETRVEFPGYDLLGNWDPAPAGTLFVRKGDKYMNQTQKGERWYTDRFVEAKIETHFIDVSM